MFSIATALLVLACLNVTGLGVARIRKTDRVISSCGGRSAPGRAISSGSSWLRTASWSPQVPALGIGLAYPMLHMTLAVMPSLVLLKAPVIDLRVVHFRRRRVGGEPGGGHALAGANDHARQPSGLAGRRWRHNPSGATGTCGTRRGSGRARARHDRWGSAQRDSLARCGPRTRIRR